MQFPHHKAMFSMQRPVDTPENFWPKFSVFHFASPEDLFSFDQFSVLPIDFLHGLFQEF